MLINKMTFTIWILFDGAAHEVKLYKSGHMVSEAINSLQ